MSELINIGDSFSSGVNTGNVIVQGRQQRTLNDLSIAKQQKAFADMAESDMAESDKAEEDYRQWIKDNPEPSGIMDTASDPAKQAGQEYSSLSRMSQEFQSRSKWLADKKKQIESSPLDKTARESYLKDMERERENLDKMRSKLEDKQLDYAGKDLVNLTNIYQQDDPKQAAQSYATYRAFKQREFTAAAIEHNKEYAPDREKFRLPDGSYDDLSFSKANQQFQQQVDEEAKAHMKDMPETYDEAWVNNKIGERAGWKNAMELSKLRTANQVAQAKLQETVIKEAAVQSRENIALRKIEATTGAKEHSDQLAYLRAQDSSLAADQRSYEGELKRAQQEVAKYTELYGRKPEASTGMFGLGNNEQKVKDWEAGIADTKELVNQYQTRLDDLRRRRALVQQNLGVTRTPTTEDKPVPSKKDEYKGHARPAGWDDAKWEQYKKEN